MPEDLIGKTIGHLTIVEMLPSDEWRRQRWRCQCDCGGEIIIHTAQFRRGYPDNCGCRKKVMRSDLTGKQIGKLIVLGPSDKRGRRGKRTVPLWECRCECGEICYKATDTLTNPDESMCAKCADISHTTKARAKAGFVDGTQVTKIRDMSRGQITDNGIRGVSFHKKSNMWRAHLRFKNQNINLGYYHNFADAVKARQRGEEKYFGTFLEEYDAQQA